MTGYYHKPCIAGYHIEDYFPMRQNTKIDFSLQCKFGKHHQKRVCEIILMNIFSSESIATFSVFIYKSSQHHYDSSSQ